VANKQAIPGASRYDAVIATFVEFALCACPVTPPTCSASKCVPRCGPSSNRQQQRARHHFTLANKRVGPAIIRHVILRVDGQPVRNWKEALGRILGPGEHLGSESDMSGHVFAAGESMDVFTPRDPENNPLKVRQIEPALGEAE